MRRRGTLVLALLLLTCVLVSCGGSNSSPPQLNPLPALSSISPAFAAAGDSAFSLAVNGTNFMPTSVVQWNSANHPTTYVSSTQLTASISAADIASGGAASITVSNPAPGGGTSSAVTFTTFAVTAGAVTADTSQFGPAMNRDQLGANLNIGIIGDSDPIFVPLWEQAGVALFRWPGGLISDYYHWQNNSYGPCSPYPNPSAAASFDNWMQSTVKPAGADVAITVNYGTNSNCTGPGDASEAAAWVDYANNVQHYGVKYWTVGNEDFLTGEPDMNSSPHDPATYASRVANEFYPLMKAKDPTILVGVDLAYASTTYNMADDTWDPIVLANAKYDFVEMHYYPERNNVDDDQALLTTWADQVAANFSATRSLLAQSGHPNTPIFFGEFDRDNLPGHETLSIVDALFIAIVLGESTNAGALMDAVWIGTENCHPDSESSPVSTAYGWQNFGGWGLFAADGSGFSDSCADKGVPKGTPFPKERSFELFHRYIVPGEKPITMTSMDSAVRAYGATNGTGYSVILINTDPNNIHKMTLNLQNSARSSFSATALTYGKVEYDLSAKGNWAPPSRSTIGSVGTTFQVPLPVWSVTLVSLQ